MTRPDAEKVAFGYSRVSTKHQVKYNNTLDDQGDTIRRYFNYRLAPEGYVFGGMVDDAGQSSTVPFLQRKNGRLFAELLKPGDAVIFSRLDRGFKTTTDLLITFELWETLGISIHLLDRIIDTSTPMGKMILTVSAGLIEYERSQTRERFQSGVECAKEKGYWPHPVAPYGYRIVKVRDERGRLRQKLAPDHEQRRLGAMALRLKGQGKRICEITREFRKRGYVSREGDTLHDAIVCKYMKQESSFVPRDEFVAGSPTPSEPSRSETISTSGPSLAS